MTWNGAAVEWDPIAVVLSVDQGRQVTLEMSLEVAYGDLEGATIDVPDELAALISVSPSSGISIGKGAAIPVQLTVSVPPEHPVGSINGLLRVREGAERVALPLPVNIVVNRLSQTWPRISVQGASLSYPPHFVPTTTPFPDAPEEESMRLAFLQPPGVAPGSFYVVGYANPDRVPIEQYAARVLYASYPPDTVVEPLEISGFSGVRYKSTLGRMFDTYVAVGDDVVLIAWHDYEDGSFVRTNEAMLESLVLREF